MSLLVKGDLLRADIEQLHTKLAMFVDTLVHVTSQLLLTWAFPVYAQECLSQAIKASFHIDFM